MATAKGRSEVKRFIAQLPAEIEKKLLRGAAREGATVVLGEASDRATSEEVKSGLAIRTKAEPSRAIATVYIKGQWPNSLGLWQEYGTAAHIIRASDAARQGMTIWRINRLDKAAASEGRAGPGHSLVIGGKFVGEVVQHPGVQPHPFLRVSLDVKRAEAVAAAQGYINARVTPSGITGPAEPEGKSNDRH